MSRALLMCSLRDSSLNYAAARHEGVLMNRRQFLKKSATLAAGVVAAGGCASSDSKRHPPRGAQLSVTTRPIGANADIRVAVIGFNGQGKQHIKGYRAIPGVRLVALC